jgi:hypothetical protein
MTSGELPGNTPLILALNRGMRHGASLSEELWKLREHRIESTVDAQAVCDLLERVAAENSSSTGRSAFIVLVHLFEAVESVECPAFAVMSTRGTELLLRIAEDNLSASPPHLIDDTLAVLKVLALYGTRAGTDAVLRAARLPLSPDEFMWHTILSVYTCGHSECQRMFLELSDPLPTGFLAVALLDSANCAFQEGIEVRHPFDSPSGIRQLESWLLDKDQSSYARSATVALEHITCNGRDALLAIALDHSSVDVQIEAARVATKLGSETGLESLIRFCCEVRYSAQAQFCLRELKLESAIPSECQTPPFLAKAELAHWLAHPNELGYPPDELEIVDHRVLAWPPNCERKEVWLIKFRLYDASSFAGNGVGLGFVGSVTMCLFACDLYEEAPEVAYATHCYWEMRNLGLIAEAAVAEDSTEFDHLLYSCSGCEVGDVNITRVAEFSQELNYPQRLIALAKATRRGVSGWLVADGPRSRWYAAAEGAKEKSGHSILSLHIGLVLLDLDASDIAR